MLPTKGYFQDIECPYHDSGCSRPYCHFRHRKKPNEDVIVEPEKISVPTYKPTPKAELESIQNAKSHIPISYVPDLAFRTDRPPRQIPKFEYKPTPLSILSSANKRTNNIEENGETNENRQAINEIKQNIANNEYNPLDTNINFEDLSNEFDLIDDILNNGSEDSELPNTDLLDVSEQEPELDKEVTDKLKVSESKSKPSESKSKSSETKLKSSESKSKLSESTSTLSERKSKSKSPKRRSSSDNKSSEKPDKSEKQTDKSEKLEKNDKHNEKHKHSSEKSKSSSDKTYKNKHSSDKNEKHKTSSEKKDKNKTSSEKEKTDKQKSHSEKKEKPGSDKHKTSDKEKSRSSSKDKSNDKHKSKEKLSDKDKKVSNSEKPKSSKDKKDSKDHDKHSSHKSKTRDRSRDRSRERHKKKHCDKSKEKEKSKKDSKHKESSSNKKEKPVETFSDHDNTSPLMDFNMSDVEMEEDDDATMMECMKIFNEYVPEPKLMVEPPVEPMEEKYEPGDSLFGKKRVARLSNENTYKVPPAPKPKTPATPGQTLTERYRQAKLAQANREQENIMNEMKNQDAMAKKRTAPPSLLEAARQHKMKRLTQATSSTGCLVDDIINGKTSAAPKPPVKKVIAPVSNFGSYQKAKDRLIELNKQRAMQTLNKTIAQTQKTGRVAHIPEFNLSDIPDVLQAEKSKLPVNVRTRFLTMLADECSKLYLIKEDAYNRALTEEFACYEKCKVLATYRNSAMLAVNRLRKEAQDRDKAGLGLLDSADNSSSSKGKDSKERQFYELVKKWLLTEEELDIHGYPKESDTHGTAVIKNRRESLIDNNLDENQRKCCRCSKIYAVDDDGWPLYEEECLYHPLKKRTIRGEQVYLCCKSNDGTGCATSDTHVSEDSHAHELEGYQTTMEPEREDDPRSYAVYALDCEMCYTTKGLELTRVTIIDIDCKTVYESLVKPLNPIIDYNTRFSGITKEQMKRTSTSILQIQANILHLCNSRTILVGHSLESDMKALKIVHGSVIDTSVLFPHKMGLPHKRALRVLASEYLKKIIQDDVDGHDSAEDAITCMELIKWKLKEEAKGKIK